MRTHRLGRRTFHGAFAAATLLGLALPSPSTADTGLILRRAVIRPGEPMTVWGPCGRMPIYLVSESLAKRAGFYYVSLPVARPPSAPPFRFLGRMVCTGRIHYVGDFPQGDWSSWSGYLRFRLPSVRPGRYQLVVYCEPCQRGRGGALVVSNWLWRGAKRIGATALTVRR